MTFLRHLRVLVAAFGASGCVLLVSPIEPGDHCTIAGESACATCIRTKCQASIDTCCSTEGCGKSGIDTGLFSIDSETVLDSVDACGRGDKNACISQLGSARSKAEEEAVRVCVTSTCNTECVEGGTIQGSKTTSLPWTCSLPRTSEKTCASCIYEKCATRLDRCCSDSSCADDTTLQKQVGACVAGDEPGCAYLYRQSDVGLEGTVYACIGESCAKECVGDGRPHASCTTYSGGKYCSCADAETSNGTSCTAAEVDGSCAVGKKGCTCGAYSCTSTTYGCTCDFDGGGGDSTCSVAPKEGDDRCCIKLGERGVTCECSTTNTSCNPDYDEFVTTDCNESTVLAELRNAKRVVTSCSR